MPADRVPARTGPVHLGVRPEKLHIQPADGSEPDLAANAVKAVVKISTYTGVSTSYQCTTSDGAEIVVYVQNLGSTARPVAAGESVRLTWDAEHTFAVAIGESRGKERTQS
jgi:spermidine/putrescine transport system ATP-binding protein